MAARSRAKVARTEIHVMLSRWMLIGIVGCGASACKGKDPGPAEPVTFASFCDAKYDPVMEKGDNILKRVSIEGHIDMPRGLFTLCSDTCNVKLLEKPGATANAISASVKVGTDENQMEALPKEYSEKDFKVHTNDGKVVGVGARVRLSGGRLGSAADKTCQLYGVDKIEALP
jgi:hypothetical protein